MVSPVEYETLGLLGSNCGLGDPDDVARMNDIANDLGVDTIEAGAMLAVLMEAGLGAFGDVQFMADCLEDMGGAPSGPPLAQGTARVGEHYKCRPCAGHQAPGHQRLRPPRDRGHRRLDDADGAGRRSHRGNLPRLKTRELVAVSLGRPEDAAAPDSLGLCIFGARVTDINPDLIVGALNDAHGTSLDHRFNKALGLEGWEWNANSTGGRFYRGRRRASGVLLQRAPRADEPDGGASTPGTCTGSTTACRPERRLVRRRTRRRRVSTAG